MPCSLGHKVLLLYPDQFCSLGMTFVGMQQAQEFISMTVLLNEMKGGHYEFLQYPPTGRLPKDMPSLSPIYFGSVKCKDYDCRLHLYLGEGVTGDWGLGKCHHYLWGKRNT